MKKRLLKMILGITLSIACITPAFGQEIYFTNPLKAVSESVEGSKAVVKQPRGNIISTGILEISNPGNGEIGVYMQTLTHVDIDETTFGIYLDRWLESEQKWLNVADYRFVYNKENSPNDNLTTKAISFNVLGQPSDCYYRLRGVHIVSSDGTREMLSSQTDGLLITK